MTHILRLNSVGETKTWYAQLERLCAKFTRYADIAEMDQPTMRDTFSVKQTQTVRGSIYIHDPTKLNVGYTVTYEGYAIICP